MHVNYVLEKVLIVWNVLRKIDMALYVNVMMDYMMTVFLNVKYVITSVKHVFPHLQIV